MKPGVRGTPQISGGLKGRRSPPPPPFPGARGRRGATDSRGFTLVVTHNFALAQTKSWQVIPPDESTHVKYKDNNITSMFNVPNGVFSGKTLNLNYII